MNNDKNIKKDLDAREAQGNKESVLDENINQPDSAKDSANPFGDSVVYTDVDLVQGLQKDNQRLQEEVEAVKSQYLRLAADFDNFRKRQSLEKQEMFKNGVSDSVKAILPVLDTFERAYLSFKTLDDVEKLRESFNVLYRQMQESLSKLQITKIKTAGEFFDPNYHEAVMREETEEHDDNAIMMELQPGYMVNDKVIRASMVKVASNSSGAVNEPKFSKQTEQNTDDNAKSGQ